MPSLAVSVACAVQMVPSSVGAHAGSRRRRERLAQCPCPRGGLRRRHQRPQGREAGAELLALHPQRDHLMQRGPVAEDSRAPPRTPHRTAPLRSHSRTRASADSAP